MPYTAAEEKFIHEYTRQLLVDWADCCLRSGYLPEAGPDQPAGIYLGHAIEKGWVSKDGTRVLAAGYVAAAGMLKR